MANLFGTGVNQVPTNGMLGNLAFQDKAFLSVDKIGIGTTATDTGTANQTLQNYGGAYISGNVGVGTTNPTVKLQVEGDVRISGITTGTHLDLTANATVNDSVLYLSGTPSSSASTNGLLGVGTLSFSDTNIIANFSNDVNSYTQLLIQNKNAGSVASADVVVNNNRSGTAGTAYYGDFGINGTGYVSSGGPFNDPDGTYLYSAGGTLSIGTNDALDFRIATGSAAATPVTRMTITGVGGSVGIGTTTPTRELDVNGTVRLRSGLYDINNNVGTASSILYSTGAGVSWTSPSFFGASNLVVYTTGSSATYTAPTGLKYALVIATGGGGGAGGGDSDGSAGGGGAGGGGGATAIRLYTSAQMGATATYTVGAAGGGGNNTGGNGTGGGATLFIPVGAGTSLTANGGALGTGSGTVSTNSSVTGAAGGTATGGQINIEGGDGGFGGGTDAGAIGIGGNGGSSFWGGAGAGAIGAVSSASGLNGTSYGSGGGGGGAGDNNVGGTGGNGVAGVIFILEFT